MSQAKRAPGQSARYHGKSLNIDRRLKLTVSSVKMRPAGMLILVVVHPDGDAVEGAYSRHCHLSSGMTKSTN
jgi:hypothetical protein